MKKQVLILLACAFGLSLNAQQVSETATSKSKYNASAVKTRQLSNNNNTAKGPGTPGIATTIFSEDFASGLPGTWTVTDLAGNGEVWAYTTTGSTNSPAGTGIADALNPTGTSAANGYMIFDSDIGGSGGGAEDCELLSPAINCTGYNTVFLSFNEFFVQYALGVGLVSVSNDGTSWTDIHNAETGLAQNVGTSNPRFVQLDISSVAANQATVYVRFKWTGDWDWYWMVDDVTIFEPTAIDAGVTAVSGVTSGCGLSAASQVTATIKNFGGSAISNVPVTLLVNGAGAINETVPGPIAPNSTLDYTFTGTVNLSAAGTYTIAVNTSLANDGTPGNDASNTQVESFLPNDLSSPYAMDFEPSDDLAQWALLDANGDGVSWALINTFAYTGTQCLRKGGSGDYDDDWVWSGCFDMQAGTNYTLDYWYRQFDLQAPCSLEVKLATAQDVAASNQLIATEVVDSIYNNSVNSFTVPSNGTYYLAFHAFIPTTNPIQGSSSLRIDNINLSVATGITENTNVGGVSIYPNPSNGLVNLRVMKFENANIRVFDVMGKEVANARMTDINTLLDLSDKAKGLYVVKVEGNGFIYTQKITLQ